MIDCYVTVVDEENEFIGTFSVPTPSTNTLLKTLNCEDITAVSNSTPGIQLNP